MSAKKVHRVIIGKGTSYFCQCTKRANAPLTATVILPGCGCQHTDIILAIVKGDYTPVYSVNSRDSRIIRLLKKGDRVATDVEVIDGQGKWTIVKKGDLTRPGFVLDENLQPGRSTKKSENRK